MQAVKLCSQNNEHSLFGDDKSPVDIVTNSSNLRKLFHIFSNKRPMTERFELELNLERGSESLASSGVLFLSKWTGDPSLRTSSGHGASFEQATCYYDEEEGDGLIKDKATSYHSVVRYTLGGLNLVVQSEVDGYFCECHCPASSCSPEPNSLSNRHRRGSASSQESDSGCSLSSSQYNHSNTTQKRNSTSSAHSSRSFFTSGLLSLDDPGDIASSQPPSQPTNTITTSPIISPTGTLTAHLAGRPFPSQCLVEVKTQRLDGDFLFRPEAQLYFSRRKQLYLARCTPEGLFRPSQNLRVKDKTEDLQKWEAEEQNQVALKKVVRLLKLLREQMTASSSNEGSTKGRRRWATVVCEGDGLGAKTREIKIELYRRDDALNPEEARLVPDGVW